VRRHQRSADFGDDVFVDRVIDLDKVAAELEERRPSWVAAGFHVGPLTWRDALAKWPQPIVTDRLLVQEPESLGLVFTIGEDEAQVCLWCGGWADVDFIAGGEVGAEAPEFLSATACVAVVDSLVGRLRPARPL
jgi:hypothetical protein